MTNESIAGEARILYLESSPRWIGMRQFDGDGTIVAAWEDAQGFHYGQYSSRGDRAMHTLEERHVGSFASLRLLLTSKLGEDVLADVEVWRYDA
jgi:hypothetical protein